MVVYLDIAFFLNFFADALALYVTARVSALPVDRRKLLLAAGLGGTYGALCALPVFRMGAAVLPELAVAAALVRLAYGRSGTFPRQFLMFFLLSCTMGGVLLAAVQLLQSRQGMTILRSLDWKVFFLAGGGCFAVLSVVFRGEARHAVRGQLYHGAVERRGRKAPVTALLDTGHGLTDGLTGAPVLTVHWSALDALWTPEERRALQRLERLGAAACLPELGAGFRLLPYRAVGVEDGLLLCFRPDKVTLEGRDLGRVTVALSPTAVSEGGANALWGGEGEKEGQYAA